MPNSIIQGLTTTTATDLNHLSAFPMTVLLGLLSKVDPDQPENEVKVRANDILEIIKVSQNVAHAINREWKTADGEQHQQLYQEHRYSPAHSSRLHQTLLQLHNQQVEIQRKDKANLSVHILDMFGYSYQDHGRQLDVHDLPRDRSRVNVGTADRPVWRVRQERGGREFDERPSGVLYRLNRELAAELRGDQGTIKYTLLARRLFSLLREFSGDPATIRLLLLILRQTGEMFSRRLALLLEDLGFDVHHPKRAVARLVETLDRLKGMDLVCAYRVDQDSDAFEVTRNANWYRLEKALEGR